MSSRREAEREARINLIAEKALQLFTASSYEEVTMDDIARAADFGKATLYHYFESKDSILFFIINRDLEQLCQLIEIECLPNQDFIDALTTYVDLRYKYYSRCFPLFVYILRRQLEGQSFNHKGSDKLKDLREQKNQLMTQLLERGIAAGVFIPGDSWSLLKAVDGLIRGFLWNNAENREFGADSTSDRELINRVLSGGILNRMAASAEGEVTK